MSNAGSRSRSRSRSRSGSRFVLLLSAAAALAMTGTARAEWARFRSPAGGFSVDFPAKPELKEQVRENTRVRQYVVKEQERIFIAGYIELPEGAVETLGQDLLHRLVRVGLLRGTQGTASGERKITLNGLPVKELDVTAGDSVGRVRSAVKGQRFYIWLAAGQPGFERSADARRFLNSFRPDANAGAAAPKSKLPVEPAPTVRVSAKPLWKATKIERAGFSVSAPGVMAYAKAAPAGREEHQWLVSVQGISYRVAYVDLPGAASSCSARDLLDQERNTLVERVQGTLAQDEPTTVGALPGSLVRINLPGGRCLQAKLVLAGTRVYRVETESSLDASLGTEVEKFLSSFALLK